MPIMYLIKSQMKVVSNSLFVVFHYIQIFHISLKYQTMVYIYFSKKNVYTCANSSIANKACLASANIWTRPVLAISINMTNRIVWFCTFVNIYTLWPTRQSIPSVTNAGKTSFSVVALMSTATNASRTLVDIYEITSNTIDLLKM